MNFKKSIFEITINKKFFFTLMLNSIFWNVYCQIKVKIMFIIFYASITLSSINESKETHQDNRSKKQYFLKILFESLIIEYNYRVLI